MRCVIALGGNALIRAKQKGTFAEESRNVAITVKHLVPILRKHRCVITHGNGPQVGDLLIQQDAGKKLVPAMPLAVCGAMSQGEIGYLLQSSLTGEGINAATVVTQVLVDGKDPAFRKPTKPVGPFYKKRGPGLVWDAGRGWRKVVPSPKPLKIIEEDEIQRLFDSGFAVIAAGGGGIPVIHKGQRLVGVEAVIDKDLAAAVLAKVVRAEIMLVLTDIDFVYLNYGKKNQKALRKLNRRDAARYLAAGQFAEGSMRPKITAALEFLRNGGKKVIITKPETADAAVAGKTGTVIT